MNAWKRSREIRRARKARKAQDRLHGRGARSSRRSRRESDWAEEVGEFLVDVACFIPRLIVKLFD